MQKLGSHIEQFVLYSKVKERSIEGFDQKIGSVILKTITTGEEKIINMCL